MAKILKSLQSDGGFSVAESTIIDPQRNVIDVNTIKVLNNSNDKTFKKEYISHAELNNTNPSVVMTPGHVVEADRIVFLTGFFLGSWEGYPIVEWTANANSPILSGTLSNHGFTTGDNIAIELTNPAYSAANGTYPVTVTGVSTFTVELAAALDQNNPILNETYEITNLGSNWEYAVKIESAVLSDPSNVLTAAASSITVVKDNVPLGHSWSITPDVNNTTKELSFATSVSTNGSLELRGTGIKWAGKIEIVYTQRGY